MNGGRVAAGAAVCGWAGEYQKAHKPVSIVTARLLKRNEVVAWFDAASGDGECHRRRRGSKRSVGVTQPTATFVELVGGRRAGSQVGESDDRGDDQYGDRCRLQSFDEVAFSFRHAGAFLVCRVCDCGGSSKRGGQIDWPRLTARTHVLTDGWRWGWRRCCRREYWTQRVRGGSEGNKRDGHCDQARERG